ncbi:MAG: 50S ribosomal protein L24e [Candidatus Thermoplasmatota archaeon]|nr:50S ribosomal protein L24e [Candidatus Thermoplasmatota archaeon]
MVERRSCNFCGKDIEPGSGRMYIRTDGTVFHFDRHKCYTNFIKLKRIPRETKWSTLSSSASRWKDRPRKKSESGQRRYVPKDLASKLRKEQGAREEEAKPHEEETGEESAKENDGTAGSAEGQSSADENKGQ